MQILTTHRPGGLQYFTILHEVTLQDGIFKVSISSPIRQAPATEVEKNDKADLQLLIELLTTSIADRVAKIEIELDTPPDPTEGDMTSVLP